MSAACADQIDAQQTVTEEHFSYLFLGHIEDCFHEHSCWLPADPDPWNGPRACRIGVGPGYPRHSISEARAWCTHSIRDEWAALDGAGHGDADTASPRRDQIDLGHGCRSLADVGHGYFRGCQLMVGNHTDVADFSKSGWCHRRRFVAGDDRWLGPHQCWTWPDCGLGAAPRRFSEALGSSCRREGLTKAVVSQHSSPAGLVARRGVSGATRNRPPRSPWERWLSDGRQMLHFRPRRYDRGSQSLAVTFGEVMAGGERLLLSAQPSAQRQKRRELTPAEATKLWARRHRHGWHGCPPAPPFAAPLQDETTLPWPEAP